MITKTKFIMEEQNTTCHHLYTMWAIVHLDKAVTAIKSLSEFSNVNVSDMFDPFIQAVQRKIYTNPAYKEAFDVLLKINPEKFEFLSLIDKEL